MPLLYLRRLTGRHRTQQANRELAFFLAFVAGAANAGGYLAFRQYTSHMSGIVSAMADNLALHAFVLVLTGLAALLSFLVGAATSAVMINWARRRNLQSEYALPLVFEASLLLLFGLLGSRLEQHIWFTAPGTVTLLCYTMGLQNAIITKLSHAEIRTTHITGMVTDIGIELGKLAYWNRSAETLRGPAVRADRDKLRVLSSLVGLFFTGGVIGALGFKHIGFLSTVPLALMLLLLAALPVLDDLRSAP